MDATSTQDGLELVGAIADRVLKGALAEQAVGHVAGLSTSWGPRQLAVVCRVTLDPTVAPQKSATFSVDEAELMAMSRDDLESAITLRLSSALTELGLVG